jgi:hypothetical protein
MGYARTGLRCGRFFATRYSVDDRSVAVRTLLCPSVSSTEKSAIVSGGEFFDVDVIRARTRTDSLALRDLSEIIVTVSTRDATTLPRVGRPPGERAQRRTRATTVVARTSEQAGGSHEWCSIPS